MTKELRIVPPEVDGLQIAADKEARLKEVPCTYKGDCNMWYFNRDGFCMYCPSNSNAKELPDEPKKSVYHSRRRSSPKRRKTK